MEQGAEKELAEARPHLLRDLFAVMLVAAALRAAHLVSVADDPLQRVPHGDGRAFLAWADRIRGGAWVGEHAFYQDPLYAYVLAAVRSVFGESLAAVYTLHALLGAAACGLLVCAGRALGGARIGLVAGLLLAVHPTAIVLEGFVQKTALATFLVCAVLARAPTAANGRGLVGFGALLGLWMLVRGEARLAAVALVAWLAWRSRPSPCATLGRVLGGLALVLAPAVVHNVVASGEWVLTTAQAGPNLYIGNRPGSNGTYAPLIPGRGDARYEAEDARWIAERAEGRELSDGAVSAHFVRRVIDDTRAEPGAATVRLVGKARLAFSRVEVGDTDGLSASMERSPVLRPFAPLVHMGTLLPLALAGVVLARRRAAWTPVLLIAGAQLAMLVVFYVFARYRFPLVPCIVLLAAECLVAAPAVLRARTRRTQIAVAAFFGGAVLAWWPAPIDAGHDRFAERYNRAVARIELGAVEVAERELEALAAEAPTFVEAWTSLGVLRARSRRLADAVTAFTRARVLSPEDPRLAGQLGTALAELGRFDEAVDLLLAAALARPAQGEIVSNAAMLALQLGRTGDAISVLRARSAVAPDDEPIGLQLAWLLATSRDESLCDGATALTLSERWADARDPRLLDVRAACLAEARRFEEAEHLARRATELASEPALRAAIAKHAAAYARRAPWRE
jgi:Flp pilus assembly protein TadD